MIARRRMVCLMVATLCGIAVLQMSAARADQAFARFIPLLVDLDGWQGKKPDGMSMDMPNNSMTTATRDYQRGPAQLHAVVVVGQAAVGALAATRTGMNVETTDGHMISTTINGLAVTKTFNTKQKSGAILVAPTPSAMFSVSYNGLTEEEALPFAQKFDWKALAATAQQK
jgi:hypothetical protein